MCLSEIKVSSVNILIGISNASNLAWSVLIISYDLFRMNSEILCKSTNIGLLVVDEGHRLKNTSGTKILSSLTSLQCNARLLLTGTPIQNNLSEFYNVANFVLPGVLGSLSSFRKGKVTLAAVFETIIVSLMTVFIDLDVFQKQSMKNLLVQQTKRTQRFLRRRKDNQ